MLIGDDRPNFLSGGSGNDTLIGNGGDDTLHGTHSSYGHTDALCWRLRDVDRLEGGAGDDVLFGDAAADHLDGGADGDILDGGDASDVCLSGERYARCESEDPPEPAPECGDAIDNDGDWAIDHPTEAQCSSPADPTEALLPDPRCDDGFDNDGDDESDYPEDYGCHSLTDEDEAGDCGLPCPPPSISINYDSRGRVFHGEITDYARPGCQSARDVLLRKKQRGEDRLLAQIATAHDGTWSVAGLERRRGRFYAVARRLVTEERGPCPRIKSETIRLD